MAGPLSRVATIVRSSACPSQLLPVSLFRSVNGRFLSGASTDTYAKLYTRTKEWCQVQTSDSESAVIRLGLSEEGLDEIGDPTSITTMTEGHILSKGDKLLDIHWEGFRRTASDELYHAVWNNVKDKRTITMPFAAKVLKFNERIMKEPDQLVAIDNEEDRWLVQLQVPLADLSPRQKDLLSRDEHLRLVDL